MKSVTKFRHVRIFAKEEVCVGCRLCEVHCAAAHSDYKGDIIKAYKKSRYKPLPRITVEESKPVSFGLQCRHCDDPRCVKSCITGAMQKDSVTGTVTNDESRCIGCWTCVLACPYGMIKRNIADKKVASKCDMCLGSGEDPVCVKNCPNQALYVVELDDAGNGDGGMKL